MRVGDATPERPEPPKLIDKKAERRAQILARARDVFARRGYHAAKIDEIVEAAGVARGTFYLYFDDKRAIFAELVDRFLARLHLSIQRIDVEGDIAAQVKQNAKEVFTLFLQDRAMAKILLTDAPGLDAEFDRKLLAIYEEMLDFLVESLEEGQSLGIVGQGDARIFAYLTVGAIKELLQQAVRRDFGEDRASWLADQVYAFLSSGYLRIPAR